MIYHSILVIEFVLGNFSNGNFSNVSFVLFKMTEELTFEKFEQANSILATV